MRYTALKRCAGLRSAQFPEDAGPMAHPIRPESYQEINNFYSMTVYEKGAEVVRMLQTLMGREVFRAGITEYFSRYDGQAVTCDDFIDAMEAAYATASPGASLQQFRRWYSQAGTPRLKVRAKFDAKARSYTLEVVQHTPRVGIEKLAEVAKAAAPHSAPTRSAQQPRRRTEAQACRWRSLSGPVPPRWCCRSSTASMNLCLKILTKRLCHRCCATSRRR